MYSLNKYKELAFYAKLLYILKKINGSEYDRIICILASYVYEMGYNISSIYITDEMFAKRNYSDEYDYDKVISAINEVCPREIAEYLSTKITKDCWENWLSTSDNIWWLIEKWDCDDIL